MAPRTLLVALPLLACLLAPARADENPTPEQRTIDLAICLDTSGSMDGLIDAARRKIWSIVNDLAVAKPTPRLRVALLTYGNDGHDKSAGWVALHTDFTEDLDLVSKQLFSFRTNGGTELVGRVLMRALTLGWQEDSDALKLIVVAGNESADQDREVDFRDMCRKAIGRGIMVNSIYCVRNEDVGETWRDIARLSDGHYAAIDQDRGTVDIATPFDAELASLSQSLNTTYVPFGKQAREGAANQKAQDANAGKLSGGAAAGRAQAKASRLYRVNWCLVDATRNKQVQLDEVKEEDLPEALRGKGKEEIQAYLDAKFAEREKIQKQVKALHAKRQLWIAAELKKRGEADDKSFDNAVRRALRAQAARKGYAFEEEGK